MFAGGRVRTFFALRLGQPATRTTWVANTVNKQGRSGPLTFVTVRNEYSQEGRLATVDETDIVYRPADSQLPAPSRAPYDGPIPIASQPGLMLAVDQALLFRFSALTYNAHRIHDDLVVHGPLQALMMGELVRRQGKGLIGKLFTYRLVAPMIGPQTFSVLPDPTGLDAGAQVRDVHGTLTAASTIDSMTSEQVQAAPRT